MSLSVVQDVFSPLKIDHSKLKESQTFLYIMPLITNLCPYYWRKYKHSSIIIQFKDLSIQECILKEIIKNLEKATAPSNDTLDKIPITRTDMGSTPKTRKTFIAKNYPALLSAVERADKDGFDYMLCTCDNITSLIVMVYGIESLPCINQNFYQKNEILYGERPTPGSDGYDLYQEKFDLIIAKKCQKCEKENCHLRCSVCGSYYCDIKCRNDDWRDTHKKICMNIRIRKLIASGWVQRDKFIRKPKPILKRMIMLISANINNKNHIFFDEFITSLIAQKTRTNRTLLSVSLSSDLSVKKSWITMKKRLENYGVEIYESSIASDFTHYERLLIHLDEENNDTFIMFIRGTNVLFNDYIYYHSYFLDNIVNNIDVIGINVLEKLKQYQIDSGTIRLKYLRRFLNNCPDLMKNHNLCYMEFYRYLEIINIITGGYMEIFYFPSTIYNVISSDKYISISDYENHLKTGELISNDTMVLIPLNDNDNMAYVKIEKFLRPIVGESFLKSELGNNLCSTL